MLRTAGFPNPSAITFGAAYSQNKQLLIYLPFNVFIDRNKYYLFGEAGYYLYSYKFYGLGTHEVPEELYDVDYPRVKLNALVRVAPRLYLGVKYDFEYYNIVGTDSGGVLETGMIPGAKGSTTSGGGPELVYDSRDSVFYPRKGIFGVASFSAYGKGTGADHSFNKWQLDVAAYHRLFADVILALNSYTSIVTGDAPFQQQSILGGNKRGRGYYEGRYIDNNLSILQAELRFPVYRRFGLAVFGHGAALGNEQRFLRTDDIKWGYGAGIRFNANRKEHYNARLDFAFGPGTSGIYLTIGEAFLEAIAVASAGSSCTSPTMRTQNF